jgi:hypothetical protein
MGNVVQIEASETAASSGPPTQASVAERTYKVLPYTGGTSHQDLYGFRESMTEPAPTQQAESDPKPAKSNRAMALLPLLIILAIGVLAIVLLPKLTKSKAPALYVDLGTQRFDSAAIGARLIARWEGSAAAYQLSIDPADPQRAAGFQAVAVNPPHPITVVIRLLDSTGVVACQKEVLLPTPVPVTAPSDASRALAPMQTAEGDTVQNIAGPDGQIAELTLTGGLPCSLKQYQSLTSWQFYTNFPSLDEQYDWLKHQPASDAANGRKSDSSNGGSGYSARSEHLPAPIDDDDVIVGDNPVRGTIDTAGGRVFLVGVAGLRNRSAEWQVFPAAIHFRCEKTGACVLTRVNSHTTLLARLIK